MTEILKSEYEPTKIRAIALYKRIYGKMPEHAPNDMVNVWYSVWAQIHGTRYKPNGYETWTNFLRDFEPP